MSGTSLVGVRRSVLTVAFTLAACALTSIPRVEAQSIATPFGVTSRSPTTHEVIPAPSRIRIRPYVEIGLYGTGVYFPDLENRVGDQPNIATVTGDKFIPGFGFGLEFGARRFPLFSRFDFNYGK